MLSNRHSPALTSTLLKRPDAEPHGGGIEVRSRIRDVVTLVLAAVLVFGAFFLVRTCGPADGQIGGGRADSCGP